MDEQFDKELKNRISKVFENFEDPSADEGWQLLREKLPGTGISRSVNWLWAGSVAAAVILLIFFGVITLVNHQKDESKKLSQQIVKPYNPEHKAASQNIHEHIAIDSSNNTSSVKNKATDAITRKTNNQLVTKNPSAKTDIALPKSNNQSITKNQVTTSPKDDNNLAASTRLGKNKLAKTQANKITGGNISSQILKTNDIVTTPNINNAENLTATKNTDTSKTISTGMIAASSVINSDTVAKTQSLIAIQKTVEKPNTKLFTEKYGIAKTPKSFVKKDAKRVQFGIYAATYLNYAQGSSNQLNVGAGIAADIRLFKNLKLSTGVAIAQNSLDYGSQLPNLNTVVNTGANLAFNLQQYAPIASTGNVAYSLVLKNYTAQLVGLDVPLNLKYEFNPQKNDSYVSLGVSSGAFIHQAYIYQYDYSSQPVQTMVTSSQLNSFYFAKTLNVAFGLGYPVGKANRLIIEPFLKYPLSGLGGEQIRFGSSGINLRFDFQSSKK